MKKDFIAPIFGSFLMFSACMSASAVTTFQFSTQNDIGNSAGNSLAMTVGGITVTETAWWLNTTAPVSGTKFGTASLDAFSGNGLGVCNPNEGVNCANPSHQVDNSVSLDFVLLAFSAPVNLNSIVLNHYSAAVSGGAEDADLTFWKLPTGLTTNTTFGSIGAGTTFNNTVSCTGSNCLVTDTFSNVSNVSYLLLAAATSNPDSNPDSFKVNTLNATLATSQGPIPEPASMVLVGSGLIACGALLRRKRS